MSTPASPTQAVIHLARISLDPAQDPTLEQTASAAPCLDSRQPAQSPARLLDLLVREHLVSIVLEPGVQAQLDPAAADDALLAAQTSALRALELARQSARVIVLLQDRGVDALLFKGVALSWMSTGRLTSRGSGDIDVLVRASNIPLSLKILGDDGWQIAEGSSAAKRRAWRLIRWSDRAITLVGHGTSVDLHWQLAKEAHLLPPAAVLLDRAETFAIAGTDIPTLGLQDALLAACYHLHHDRYSSLRQCMDVVRLVQRCSEPVKWQGRELDLVEQAVNFAVELLGGIPTERLRELGIGPRTTAMAHRQWETFGLASLEGPRQLRPSERVRLALENYRYGNAALEAVRFAVRRSLRKA